MTPLDLAVIGGGITGLGVARLAARNGLTVTLLERGDLASGASSATSHMLHGGLRYLEHGHFSLVREALAERAALGRMAPDLIRPTRFLVPIYRGDRRGPWMVRAGLALYDAFAGRANLAPHGMIPSRVVPGLEPAIALEGLRAAALYSDAVMDDARLAIAVARDAAAHGAGILTHTEVVGARPAEPGAIELLARDRIQRREQRVVARAVVNATGAWTDGVRMLLARALAPGSADPAPLLRPTRGVHLVYPPLTRTHGVLALARTDGRAFFVVPFRGHALVGTTEVETASPPGADALEPSVEELRYLRAELARVLPHPARMPALAVTAGLRPLLSSAGDLSQVSREHRVIDEHGVISVAGGKYTTFRPMARDAVARVLAVLGLAGKPVCDPVEPLPRFPAAEGSLAGMTEFAVRETFARRLEDVLRRRTFLWLTPDRGRVAAPTVAAVMERLLGWSAERTRTELQAYDVGLEAEERLLVRMREHG